ncbi:hypothetical protein, partial [Nonomuraea sp. MG754425]|uniref:hypothetical protein n=1 Tax=Nonomuraea sp. MG754425 TaxID=2570319 RepID=UPI001F23E9F3
IFAFDSAAPPVSRQFKGIFAFHSGHLPVSAGIKGFFALHFGHLPFIISPEYAQGSCSTSTEMSATSFPATYRHSHRLIDTLTYTAKTEQTTLAFSSSTFRHF